MKEIIAKNEECYEGFEDTIPVTYTRKENQIIMRFDIPQNCEECPFFLDQFDGFAKLMMEDPFCSLPNKRVKNYEDCQLIKIYNSLKEQE